MSFDVVQYHIDRAKIVQRLSQRERLTLEQQLKEALLDLAKASTSTTAHQAKSKEPENGEKSQSPAVNSHSFPAGAHGAESPEELDPG